MSIFKKFKNWLNPKKKETKNNIVLPNIGNMYDLYAKKQRERLNLETIDLRADPGFADARLYYGSTYEGTKTRKFTIPVGSLTREQAEAQIKELMSDYHTDIDWNDNYIPPKAGKQIFSEIDPYGEENWEEDVDDDLPHGKNYWFPVKKRGGLKHFRNNLNRQTEIMNANLENQRCWLGRSQNIIKTF